MWDIATGFTWEKLIVVGCVCHLKVNRIKQGLILLEGLLGAIVPLTLHDWTGLLNIFCVTPPPPPRILCWNNCFRSLPLTALPWLWLWGGERGLCLSSFSWKCVCVLCSLQGSDSTCQGWVVGSGCQSSFGPPRVGFLASRQSIYVWKKAWLSECLLLTPFLSACFLESRAMDSFCGEHFQEASGALPVCPTHVAKLTLVSLICLACFPTWQVPKTWAS